MFYCKNTINASDKTVNNKHSASKYLIYTHCPYTGNISNIAKQMNFESFQNKKMTKRAFFNESQYWWVKTKLSECAYRTMSIV